VITTNAITAEAPSGASGLKAVWLKTARRGSIAYPISIYNPIRAGIVIRPEEYRWNSLGYHFQQQNKDGFLSLDFGLVEFGVLDETELTALSPVCI
jgi:hypothetical protein